MDFERLLSLLRALDEQRVDYVLVGGAAVNLHGILRATEDTIRPIDKADAAALRDKFDVRG